MLSVSSYIRHSQLYLALYALTFQIENMPSDSLDISWIKTGLDHWKSFWPSPTRDEELSSGSVDSGSNGWKRVGFMRHAPEYWFLTHSVLTRIQRRGSSTSFVKGNKLECDDTGMAQLNELVNEFRIGR